MSILKDLQGHVSGLEFQKALIDTLGWNHPERETFSRTVQGRVLKCRPIAEGGGFEVVEITEQTTPEGSETITAPKSRGLRTAVDTDVSKVSTSHVLAFVDQARSEAVFVVGWVRDGKRYVQERRYRTGLPIAPLVAFLAEFAIPYKELDPHGELPHTKMLDLLDSGSATAEKVSKKFYNDLAAKRKAFEPFLKWIADEDKRAWYVTALLNRLMFIYFVQQKRLVNDDPHFLRNLLIKSEASGKDRFYKEYFLPLCFFGFGKPKGERGEYENLFKDVVYLNGGLFALHTVESEAGVSHVAVADGSLPASLYIPDAEFRKWFDFFDSWRWTLDEENAENDGEINPGILGYIFEKYVNQKQMGAYYTKEDITGYICRNTIVSRLFDMLAEAGAKGKQAVDPLPIGPHPNILNDGNGISDGEGIERYVYAAVKTKDALPTETPREYAARRTRFDSILQDFEDRKITTVNDFISYNLDIEKMAADFVDRIQNAQVLHDLYFRCLTKITVLDPTCGSGAFLFAALKVLYPLYDRCLLRMEHFKGNEGHGAATLKGDFAFVNAVDVQPTFLDPGTVTDPVREAFAAELKRIAKHPRAYYITKSIIVNNLYGVDIMDEAVEICKLRLFLKLAAHATPDPTKDNQGIEPLPDIDFNILAGNTLVGYVNTGHIGDLWAAAGLPFNKDFSWQSQVEAYGELVRQFRAQQLGERFPRTVTNELVAASSVTVKALLDADIRRLYVECAHIKQGVRIDSFRKTHHPFHWLLEFPGVTESGGFDVVVGNPPWKEYSAVRRDYTVLGYSTEETGNLHALCTERAFHLARTKGRVSFIVQLPLMNSTRMAAARQVLRDAGDLITVVPFDDRPGRLFDGLEHCRSTVFSARKASGPSGRRVFTAGYQRWSTEARPTLMPCLRFAELLSLPLIPTHFPKYAAPTQVSAFARLANAGLSPLGLQTTKRESRNFVFYQEATQYWVKATVGLPFYEKNGAQGAPAHGRYVFVRAAEDAYAVSAVLNSNLFYCYFIAYGDCFHLSDTLVTNFPVPAALWSDPNLVALGRQLMGDLTQNAEQKTIRTAAGDVISYAEFYGAKSKSIIDEIDRVMATYYGFTAEELDFIINYDIKYRMGAGNGEAE